MKSYIRAYRSDSQEEGGPLRFIAATEAIARDGMIIQSDGWQLDNYRANPVVLWAHDYTGQRPPIGRAEVSIDENSGNLMADISFDPQDAFASEVERKYRTGYLNAVSVGWNTLDATPSKDGRSVGTVTKAELLDISAVPVPGDPGALMERQARGLADLGTILARLTDGTNETDDDGLPEDVDWAGTVALMARLYLNIGEETEDQRKRSWVRLARRYERQGKQPPEYLSRAELSVLGADEIRGLFLSGEENVLGSLAEGVNERAGAVLSTRNKGDLEQAVSLIRSVLDRASIMKESERDGGDVEDDKAVTDNTSRGLQDYVAVLEGLRSRMEKM